MKVRIVKDTMPNTVHDSDDPSMPTVLYREWADVISCGCKVVVGFRLDTYEPTTVSCPCGTLHMPQIMDFQRRITASLDDPKPTPLVEVVRDLLEEAFA